jgi:hypothetical protein
MNGLNIRWKKSIILWEKFRLCTGSLLKNKADIIGT